MEEAWLAFIVVVLLFTFEASLIQSSRRSLTPRKRPPDPPLTQDEFAALYVQVLHECQPGLTAQVTGPLEVNVEKEGREWKTSLDDAWLLYCGSPQDGLEVIRRYVDFFMVEIRISTEPLAAASIVPMIKGAAYVEILGTDPEGRMAWLGEPLVGDLWVLYARDLVGAKALLTERDREQLGLSLAEIRETAVENFRTNLPEIAWRDNGMLFVLAVEATLNASLLLVDEVWEESAELIQGDIVAAVPQRDVLLFTGTDCADGVHRLRETAGELFRTSPYAISPNLFVRRDGKWEVFEPAHE